MLPKALFQFLLFWIICSSQFARASELNILTSFPPSFYTQFQSAFNREHPDIELYIRNKKTTAGINYLKRSSDHGIDLFWASSPDAFEILKSDSLLHSLPSLTISYPDSLLSYPLKDKHSQHFGFALSGYGIMFNQNYLTQNQLDIPTSWKDLTQYQYYSHLALSSPSRSGTTHLMIEMILQHYGWDEGWKIILQIASNAAAITARSYSVPEGVTIGRFGLGMVIDFLSQKIDSVNIQFNYAQESSFLPASFAILKEAKNKKNAEIFMAFVLSKNGQNLLQQKNIARLPIDPDIYALNDKSNPFTLSDHQPDKQYDPVLSKQRFQLINTIFDHFITFQLQTLQRVKSKLIKAEKSSINKEAHSQKVRLIRNQLSSLPISMAQAELLIDKVTPINTRNSGYLTQPLATYKQHWINNLLQLELELENL